MINVNNEGIVKSLSLLQNELKNIASNRISLCNKDIFKDFYIDRGFEEDFLSSIESFDDILLTGRAGSGKSTLIKKVLAENEEYCNKAKFCTVLINCETEYSINSSENIFLEIKKYIYEEIFSEHIGVSKSNEKESFAKKILNESLSLTSYRKEEAQKLINIYTNHTRKNLNSENFNDFFEEVSSPQSELKIYYDDFLNSIFEKKEKYLPSLLYYLNETKKINFFFIFDNVDSLPHSKQIETYKEFLQFKINIMPRSQQKNNNIKIKTIISLRDENYRGRNGSGVLRIQHFSIMNQTKDFFISGIQNAANDETLIFKVLSNKISYLMKHRVKEDSEHNIEVLDASSLGAISALLDEWSKNKFIVGNIFKYSNYSIRHAMYNILDFLLWLIQDIELTFQALRHKKFLEINSLYIAWIASKKKIIQKIEGLDLVQLEKNVSDSQYTNLGCDISILVLNFIKNMNKDALGLPRVRFSEIVKEFDGFADKQLLRQLIYDMYMLSNEVSQSEEYGHIIYMPLHDDTFQIDDITDDILLALYPRAEELLFLSQTFTFISIIYERENGINTKEYFNAYNTKIGVFIDNHYEFLEKLVIVHIIELYRIYNKWKDKVSKDENWYTSYLQKFSLEDKFQIEQIVILTKAFLGRLNNKKYQYAIDRLESLKEQYLKDIQSIPSNIENKKYVYTKKGKEINIEKDIGIVL